MVLCIDVSPLWWLNLCDFFSRNIQNRCVVCGVWSERERMGVVWYQWFEFVHYMELPHVWIVLVWIKQNNKKNMHCCIVHMMKSNLLCPKSKKINSIRRRWLDSILFFLQLYTICSCRYPYDFKFRWIWVMSSSWTRAFDLFFNITPCITLAKGVNKVVSITT